MYKTFILQTKTWLWYTDSNIGIFIHLYVCFFRLFVRGKCCITYGLHCFPDLRPFRIHQILFYYC